MHLAFLGLGQIGGSIARAATATGHATRFSAWTPNGAGPGLAESDGIVAAATAADAVRGADLIVLAAPPLACLDLLDDLGGPLGRALAPDAVITDVASTKASIVARARIHGLRFVGGHPMAGRELAGYLAADPGLVRDRPWVIVPASPVDVAADARVVELIAACGARAVRMTADEHDAAVASVSHLPLVLSAALVETMSTTAGWPEARRLAAGGWAGMTRLARGDVEMGTGILATNGAAVADRLRSLRAVLDGWLAELEADEIDAQTVRTRLALAHDAARSGDDDTAAGRPAADLADPDGPR